MRCKADRDTSGILKPSLKEWGTVLSITGWILGNQVLSQVGRGAPSSEDTRTTKDQELLPPLKRAC